MALDYIIGALQLLSASVNVLALGSFWVTPGLRTTANRFVINLLIVNIVGCLALTPALWLNGGLVPEVHSETQPIYDDESTIANGGVTVTTVPTAYDASLTSQHQQQRQHANFGVSSTIKSTIFVEIFEQRGTDDVEIIADIHAEKNHTTDKPRMNQTRSAPAAKNVHYSDCTRFWGFDLVAALGKISYTLLSHKHSLATYWFIFKTVLRFDANSKLLFYRSQNATLLSISIRIDLLYEY